MAAAATSLHGQGMAQQAGGGGSRGGQSGSRGGHGEMIKRVPKCIDSSASSSTILA
jgi:hypothetical protein